MYQKATRLFNFIQFENKLIKSQEESTDMHHLFFLVSSNLRQE